MILKSDWLEQEISAAHARADEEENNLKSGLEAAGIDPENPSFDPLRLRSATHREHAKALEYMKLRGEQDAAN